MALKQLQTDSKDRQRCPRCSETAIIIAGKTVTWLKCPKCKFTKLIKNKKEPLKVIKLRDGVRITLD